MKDTSATMMSTGSVGPLHTDDPGITAHAFVELFLPHVHGVDFRRPVLEQAVGEAARGGTGVEADEPGDVQLEMFDGGEQLVRAPADVAFDADQRKNRIRRQLVAGLVHFLKHAGPVVHRHLARHDQPLRHFAAFRQPLHENQLIRAFLALRHMPPVSERIARPRDAGLGLPQFRHDATRSSAARAA